MAPIFLSESGMDGGFKYSSGQQLFCDNGSGGVTELCLCGGIFMHAACINVSTSRLFREDVKGLKLRIRV